MNQTFNIASPKQTNDYTGRFSPTNGSISALQRFPPAARLSPSPDASRNNNNYGQYHTTGKPPSVMGLSPSVMNSTGGASAFKASQVGAPQFLGASKKLMSAAIPGGLAINAPENNRAENAFARENNRVTGFGPGMGAAIIGN